jgi:hypothetical protein
MSETKVLTPAEVHLLRMKRVPTLTHRDIVDLCDFCETLRAENARLTQENADLDQSVSFWRAATKEADEALALAVAPPAPPTETPR